MRPLNALIRAVGIATLVFAQGTHADDTGQPAKDKICAFTDIACNLGKVGKTVKGLGVPKEKTPFAVAYSYHSTGDEARCYKYEDNVVEIRSPGHVRYEMGSCKYLIDTGVMRRIAASVAGTEPQSSSTAKAGASGYVTGADGQPLIADCKGYYPKEPGGHEKVCVDPRTGRPESRLNLVTHKLGPLKPGDDPVEAATQKSNANWDALQKKNDAAFADLKQQMAHDDAQREARNKARHAAFDKCMALKDSAIAAQTNGDKSKMESFQKCLRDAR